MKVKVKEQLKGLPVGKDLVAINIAIKKEDGTVENDTVYSEKYLTYVDAQNVANRYNCEVIISHIGHLKIDDEKEIAKRTFVVKAKKRSGGKK